MRAPSDRERAGTAREPSRAALACPRCGEEAVFPSRLRSRLEALVARVTPLRPYRCHECSSRRWRARPPATDPPPRALRARWRALRGALAEAAGRARLLGATALRIAAAGAALLLTLELLLGAGRWATHRLAELAREPATATATANAAPPAAAPGPAPAPAARARPSTAKPPPAVRAAARRTSTLAPAGARTATPAPGGALAWEGARWGMSVREVEAALPPRVLAVRHGRGGAHHVARTLADVGARRYVAELRFDGDAGLDEIQLRPADEPADAEAAFDEAVAWLTARHGAPSDRREDASPAGSWERTVAWRGPGTRVLLRAWRTALRDAHVLRFDVRSGAVTPTPTGVEVIYAPAVAR